jgi:hypothetical protein
VVRTAERHLDDIGPGDFFGEIAALDRGASFGYARLATVTATSPMRNDCENGRQRRTRGDSGC